MREMYLYCEKYDKWKKREEFVKTVTITDKCDIPQRTNCGLCKFNKIQWVEED